jgi:hypothetical protein
LPAAEVSQCHFTGIDTSDFDSVIDKWIGDCAIAAADVKDSRNTCR